MFDDRIGNLQKMLARMGPEGRQRYAADHADDPIAVSMALFVNNIAKELKEGKRGEPEIQTPVVQQAIQAMNQPRMPPQGMPQQAPQQIQQQAPQAVPQPAMPQQQSSQAQPQVQRTQMAADGGYMDSRLPEEMGIGALPERSLSNMADGGIVGFADGGDVQRFQSGGTPKPRPMYPGMIGQEGEGLLPNTTGYEGMGILEFIQKFGVDAYNKIKNAIPGESTEARLARQKQEVYDASLSGQRDKAMTEVNASAPVDSMNLPPRKLGPYSRTGVLPDQTSSGGAEDPNGVSAPRPPAPPAAGAGAGAGAAPRPAAAAPAGAPASGLQTLLTSPDLTPEAIAAARKKFTDLQPPVVDPLKEERQKIVDAEEASGLEALQQHKDRVAKQGDPYAKQEERANKQEASIAESAERSPYLALMEAGFAAMAGDSPYAMVNLGKGALAGTKTYRDGLALIEKAKEKLTETRDRIDGLRLIRSDLNASEERTILNQNRKTALDGARFMFAGLAAATGESKAQVENNIKLFMEAETARRLASRNAELERFRQGEETKRSEFNASSQAGIAAANRAMQQKIAGMPSKEAQMAVSLGTGDTYEARLLSGLQKIQDLSADKSGAVYAKMYADHVADAKKTMVEPMSPTEYAASIRSFLSVFKPTVVDDSKVKGNPPMYSRPSP